MLVPTGQEDFNQALLSIFVYKQYLFYFPGIKLNY